MGDMTDYLLESEDFVDIGLYGSGGLKQCRYCGQDGLHWERIKGSWRLCDPNCVVHVCASVFLGRNGGTSCQGSE